MPSAGGTAASDSELRAALERALAAVGVGTPGEIRRRPSRYRTSFPLEELDVALDDGTELRLLLKDLSWAALDSDARLAKPEFLYDPRREPAVYAAVLAPRGLGPRYYGSAIDPAKERYWLFLERVEGRELYQVGDVELWRTVAGWLGVTHAALVGDLDRLVDEARLIEYDEPYYRRWIERAQRFARAAGQPRSRRQALDWIEEGYDSVVENLLAAPQTVIHGELYASNVLVGATGSAARVCPVDWELAASAPGTIDLAALVSGGWAGQDREAIIAAYRAVAGAGSFSDEQLDFARLHLAVQWLGWAPPAWSPPEEHRHDWLGEALALAEGLGL